MKIAPYQLRSACFILTVKRFMLKLQRYTRFKPEVRHCDFSRVIDPFDYKTGTDFGVFL